MAADGGTDMEVSQDSDEEHLRLLAAELNHVFWESLVNFDKTYLHTVSMNYYMFTCFLNILYGHLYT